MKIRINQVIFTIIIVFLIVSVSCEKEKKFPDGRFIGTWVSVDKRDSLIFISDDILMRPAADGIKHTYIYNYTNDSITLQYKGPYLILVEPSTHSYFLSGDNLEIDFTNGGYGFDRDVIDFKRE